MKKRVPVLILLICVFSISLVFAANETTSSEVYEKGYDCLEDKLGDNCGSAASTEQATLSLMAIAYKSSLKSDCKEALLDFEKEDCFSTSKAQSCEIKSTAQAVLALNYINKDVDDYIDWLLDKKQQTINLEWYLELDANEESICKISADGVGEKSFTMNANKRIIGSSSCLSPAENGYFLKISNGCYNKNFSISCDKDFITTLLYKKAGSSVYYVSSKTHSSSAEGTTEERIKSYCLGLSKCDYQGTLWGAIALSKAGEDVSPYIPYLTSMYDEEVNRKYFPAAFLLMLTGADDYYVDVKNKQKQGKFWDESGNKYYDTALALASLDAFLVEEVTNAKEYLIEIQDSSGCWHSDNIRDTAFILYAGWPREATGDSIEPSKSGCSEFGYYCTSPTECGFEYTLDNFYCPGLSEVCCQVEPLELTCLEKDGIICSSDQECTGSEIIASDTNECCMDSCIVVSTETECEEYGYYCSAVCEDSDEEKFYDCGFGRDRCCGETTEPEPEPSNWLIIILLIVLIILLILAIIFRNQLKIWFFKAKSKFKKGKGPRPTGRPPLTPQSSHPLFARPMPARPRPAFRRRPPVPRGRPLRGRPLMPRGPGRPAKQAPRPGDKDFEDTMKKLKEMSK